VEMLRRVFVRKNFGAVIAEVDVDESATAAVIGVAFGKTFAVAVAGEDINAIDLESNGRGRGPDECAHASVADWNAGFAAIDGSWIIEIGASEEVAEVD